ncbi:toxin-antitoxin system YwqK family antitoxin [Flavobacterium sp. N2820]|jgi:antitoxin component YwqK of YwqJK toxin-antitoxin module|uniref:toxin-antitoxin system YwqK family antitoxin n=1 Tax=Flavobacterium sp. N2820 TaxID=2986834 RepID=UPI002224E5BF|nr:membrane-binding protein [Flavobacterium sp. N2820]
MKNIMIAGIMLVTSLTFAQEVKPKYEIIGQEVKTTYYYDNGQIKQEGNYLNGKPNGKWVSYNEDGTKQAIGEFENGSKKGKWFFWSEASLTEVDFSDSRIAEVKKWSKDVLVKN